MSSVLLVEPSSSGLGLIRAVRDAGLDPVVLTWGRDDRRIPPEHLRLAAYERITGVEALERLPGFHEIGFVVPPGRRIPEPCSSLGRIAYAVFSAPSCDRLRALLDETDRLLTFHETTPADPAPAGSGARRRAA